jgi:Leucine-rich repeat (LRR) protein
MQKLTDAINKNQWCQDNLEGIFIPGNKLYIIPQFNCHNLRRLYLNKNYFFEFPNIANTPNLRELYVNNLRFTRVRSVNKLNELRTLRILDNKLRVPPNVVFCTNLRNLGVIDGNPLTWLGKYALLLMEKHNPNLGVDLLQSMYWI